MGKKRLLGLFIISLLAISLFTGFASAQTAGSEIFDPVYDMFASWEEGDFSPNIAKYLFLFLLALVFYSVLGFMPFIEEGKEFIKWPIAFIVAFLATAYLTPSDIYTMLAGYGALGIVVGTIIPFIILFFFSLQVHKKGGLGGRLFAKIMWAAFLLFLLWKLIDGMFFQEVISKTEGFFYIGFMIVVFWYMTKGEKWLIEKITGEELDMVRQKAFEEVEEADVLRKADKKRFEALKERTKK